MPKLPSLTPEKVIKVLKRKGFVLDRVKGSHHICYHPETKRRVVVPLHKRDLPKGILLENLKQASNQREIEGIIMRALPNRLCGSLTLA